MTVKAWQFISGREEELSADDFFTGGGSISATKRLLKGIHSDSSVLFLINPVDYKNLTATEGKYGFVGGPRGDNLYLWDVEMGGFEQGTLLAKDLASWAAKSNNKPVWLSFANQ